MSTHASQFDEYQACLYCGCPVAHECAGVPVCDKCCIGSTDMVIAFPEAKEFLERIIEYRVHGRPQPAPQYIRARREDFITSRRPTPETTP